MNNARMTAAKMNVVCGTRGQIRWTNNRGPVTATAQAASAVAPPMLNDPDHWEPKARRFPIAPSVILLDALTDPIAVLLGRSDAPHCGRGSPPSGGSCGGCVDTGSLP